MIKYEDLKIGQSASLERKITEKSISDYGYFIAASSESNTGKVKDSLSNDGITQKSLVCSMFTALIGNKLPGQGYFSINYKILFSLNFSANPGDVIIAESKVFRKLPGKMIELKLTCFNKDKIIVEGSSLVKSQDSF